MATSTASAGRVPRWVLSLGPLAIIGLLIALFVALDPIGSLRDVPPVEAISFERVALHPGEIELHLRNDGPDPVTIAQVLVDDTYWAFDASDSELGRLETSTITLRYPWDEGVPLNIALVSSTGATFEHEIEVAAETPEADGKVFTIYGLLGLYIGVIPVAVGLLWYPALRRASRRALGFLLAFTVGLLAFLLIDTVAEGFELAAEVPAALNGLAVFVTGALGALLGLFALEGFLARKRQGAVRAGLTVAYLVAAGIGLHNLGEGLAVGAALAAGEVALGTFLILGFALHNTTEGLAIVAPLGGEAARPRLVHLVALGAVAGVPTIFGAWAGGFAFSPTFAAMAFGVAAGAIAQVVWTIGRHMPKGAGLSTGVGALGFLLGLIVMYVTGLFTA
ncbi:MAG TPA: metal transporter [Actinomycetota bacterium]|jgi:zinc transporter ZupT